MAQHLLSNRPDYGRTFQTAVWTVGFAAAILVLIALWGVVTRPPLSFQSGSDVPSPGPPSTATAERAPAEESRDDGGGGLPSSGGGSPSPVRTAPPAGSREGGAVEPAPPAGAGALAADGAAGPTLEPLVPAESAVDSPAAGGFSAGGSSISPGSSAATSNSAAAGATSALSEPSFRGPEEAGPAARSLSEELSDASLASGRIEDRILERFVSLGEEHRAEGNMRAALEAFRKAEAEIPDHPRVLAELAATLGQMGLDGKADAYWERVVALGPGAAGSYFELAKRQVEGGEARPAGAGVRILSVGEVKVNEEPPGEGGQRVSLRVGIEARSGARPRSSDLSLLVDFYDRVDGERVEETTADTSFRYPTEPYDWHDGRREEIVVLYEQPAFSEEQKRDLGERRYCGYAIELYYRDRLQDRVVRPEDVAEVRAKASGAGADREPPPVGPEDSLFPE